MRVAEPWYWEARNAWFVQLDGKRHPLGAHPEGEPPPKKKARGGWKAPRQILDAFTKLKEKLAGQPTPTPGGQITIRRLAEQFDRLYITTLRPNSQITYRCYLEPLRRRYPDLPARSFKKIHLTELLQEKPTPGRMRALAAVSKKMFSWAVEQGLLESNPLLGVKLHLPRAGSRKRVLTEEEKKLILSETPTKAFRDMLELLFLTGARPGEIRLLEAAHVHLEEKVIVLLLHKTSSKSKKQRVIYLPDQAIEILTPYLREFPEGPLFRPHPRRTKAYHQKTVQRFFRLLRQRHPELGPEVISYTSRHTFATNALLAGVGVAQLVELLGHTTPTQIFEHYGHLAQNIEHLRTMAEKASNPPARERD